ncbi:hypothetical protein M2405_004487 [Rhodococcus erythropolis]|nr:hypothetical protein [Rhodococcus erythropolis]MCW2428044.1 hypothetical protein [Rhodococcus erythropolis]
MPCRHPRDRDGAILHDVALSAAVTGLSP